MTVQELIDELSQIENPNEEIKMLILDTHGEYHVYSVDVVAKGRHIDKRIEFDDTLFLF